MSRDTIIAIDCDGTIFEHRFPSLGNPVPGAFEWMRKFQAEGAKLILYTMRGRKTNVKGSSWDDTLEAPIIVCRDNGIEFWGINVNPEQHTWTNSEKCWAHVFIDDHGVCVPLLKDSRGVKYVDWSIVGPATMQIIQERKNRG